MPVDIGVCAGGKWIRSDRTDDDLKRDLEGMADTGFKWVRYGVPWSTIEQKPGEYYLDRFAKVARMVKDAGMRSLPVGGYTPTSYQDPALPKERRQFAMPLLKFLPAYRAHAEALFAVLKELDVKRYAVWNESNHAPFMMYPSVHAQAALVRELSAAATKVHPQLRFVLGEMSPGATKKDSKGRYVEINMVDYVKQWYQAGYKHLVEGTWSVHPYFSAPVDKPYDPLQSVPWNIMSTQYDAILAELKANGHGTKKIWGTELGHTTRPWDGGGRPQLSEQMQADRIVAQLDAWRNRPNAGPGFLFVWQDFKAPSAKHPDAVNGLGVNHLDGTPKLARSAVKELLT